MEKELKFLSNRIKALSLKIEKLKAEMNNIVLNHDLTKNDINIIYWNFPEIPATVIEKNVSDYKKQLEPLPLYKCNECGYEGKAKSRTARKEIEIAHNKGTLKCPECIKKENENHSKSFEDYIEKYNERLVELKSMPYKDYLQTPEWQENRKAHLKRSGYKCQVCNASGKKLNVHHRTYERRGQEWSTDLITLCEDCHELFHKEGKLQ